LKRAALAMLIAGFAAGGLAHGQTSGGLNEAQEELLDTLPDDKDSPDGPMGGGAGMDTTIEQPGMGNEAGLPASISPDPGIGEVDTNVEPGSTAEMGSGAGENPDPIGGG